MLKYKLCWLLFCLISLTWPQAASARYLSSKDFIKTILNEEDDSSFHHDEKSGKNMTPDITENDLPKNGELFEGDMVMDDTIRRAVLGIKNEKRSGIISSEVGNVKHWPNGIIPYTLNDNLLPEVRSQILKGIKEVARYTCVKFIPKKQGDVDWVDFQDGNGCSSSVGRQGGMQVIHLAGGCKRIGTVIHEMMHTMGIIHEQSRPDRDSHVFVRFDHIKPSLSLNFRKYSYGEADNLNIPYNFYSVMHYSNYAFSKDNEKTLISKSDPNLKFGQRMQLTPLDIEQVKRLYPCKKKLTSRQVHDLIPNMTEHDVEEKKRDEERELFDEW